MKKSFAIKLIAGKSIITSTTLLFAHGGMVLRVRTGMRLMFFDLACLPLLSASACGLVVVANKQTT